MRDVTHRTTGDLMIEQDALAGMLESAFPDDLPEVSERWWTIAEELADRQEHEGEER